MIGNYWSPTGSLRAIIFQTRYRLRDDSLKDFLSRPLLRKTNKLTVTFNRVHEYLRTIYLKCYRRKRSVNSKFHRCHTNRISDSLQRCTKCAQSAHNTKLDQINKRYFCRVVKELIMSFPDRITRPAPTSPAEHLLRRSPDQPGRFARRIDALTYDRAVERHSSSALGFCFQHFVGDEHSCLVIESKRCQRWRCRSSARCRRAPRSGLQNRPPAAP